MDAENNGVEDLTPEEREKVREYMRWLGQRGGRTTGYRKKRGNSDYYSRLGRMGKGKKKKKKAAASV